MSLKQEINSVCTLFTLMEEAKNKDSLGFVAQKTDKKSSINIDEAAVIEKITLLSKGIEFPALKIYITQYLDLYQCYLAVTETHRLKQLSDFRKDYRELMEYVNFEPDYNVESITIKVNSNYTPKFTSKILTSTIMEMITKRFEDFEYMQFDYLLSEDGIVDAPRLGKYKKEFIKGFYPMFCYLKEHNSNLTDIKIREYLGEFTVGLGFNFYDRGLINSPVDSDTIRKYFEDIA
ncbi:hypothetical protein [Draconibacterium mangrovi]|uniref:hypothetical protein n=1 Tax=Draconibacterium mangrovi TaxID=2697469 RepID=UPI0013D18C3C|nr:hypothetical protein [Draconibacterium mangrovi]